jgi:hypothetical protein
MVGIKNQYFISENHSKVGIVEKEYKYVYRKLFVNG